MLWWDSTRSFSLCLGRVRTRADAQGLSDKFRVWLQRQGLRASRARCSGTAALLSCWVGQIYKGLRLKLVGSCPQVVRGQDLVELRIRARPYSIGFRWQVLQYLDWKCLGLRGALTLLGPALPCQALQGGVIPEINCLAFLALFSSLLMACSSHKSRPGWVE